MQPLCRACFGFLNGVSRGKLQRLINSYTDPKRKKKSISRKEGSGRHRSEKWLKAFFWFTLLVAAIGESSPQSTEIHLPPSFRKEYYTEYCREHLDGQCISEAAFFEMWRDHFSHVKVHTDIENYTFRSLFVNV